MQTKKERTHQCGLSNIDFRRLNDRSSLQQYQDDKRFIHFGLFGRTGNAYSSEVSPSWQARRNLMSLSLKFAPPPDPRIDTAAKRYVEASKPLHLPAPVDRRRVAQLEDPRFTHDVFTGEDVAGLSWYRATLSPNASLVRPLAKGSSSPAAGTWLEIEG
jgi:hypothetical protein